MRKAWNKVNEIWNKYNNLTIIDELEPYKKWRSFSSVYLCKCDCGKQTSALITNLRRWFTKTCWCQMKSDVKDLDWEIWKDYDVYYQVSNLWRVKWEKGLLKPRITKTQYHSIRLYDHKLKKYKQFLLHRLVMLVFEWKNKLDVNHKNWIKTDNRLENLEYCTKSENMIHAFKTWLCKIKKGKEHHLYWKIWKDNKDSVKVRQYSLEWEFIKLWDSMADIKRELWFSTWNICMVCKWQRNQSNWYKWSYN